jgi:hypothetical protein
MPIRAGWYLLLARLLCIAADDLYLVAGKLGHAFRLEFDVLNEKSPHIVAESVRL